jgi:hypothetical protein
MAHRKPATKTKAKIDPRLHKLNELKTNVTALTRTVQTMSKAATAPAQVPRAAKAITREQIEILSADPSNAEIAILPTGELYLPHLVIRRRLNSAFGTGCWVVRECSPVSRQGAQVIQSWAIDIDGIGERARATGGAEYRDNNKRTTWDDAIESAKSIAISRCGKAMGIGIILSDKNFQRSWRARHCGVALVKGRRGDSYQWRRLDDDPFDGEIDFADPTKDATKAAQFAKQVRRKMNDDMQDDPQPARPTQSRSGQVPPSQQGARPAPPTPPIQNGEVLPATTGGVYAPPPSFATPQVFTHAEFIKDEGNFKLHQCETVYALGDGRTGKAQYAFFDADWLPKIKNLIVKKQPVEIEWVESKTHRGRYRIKSYELLTGEVK